MKTHESCSRYRSDCYRSPCNLRLHGTKSIKLRSLLILKQIADGGIFIALNQRSLARSRLIFLPRNPPRRVARARPIRFFHHRTRGVIAIVFSNPPMVVELTTELRAHPPRGPSRKARGVQRGVVPSSFFRIRARTTIIRVITGMNIHRRAPHRRRESASGEKRYLHCGEILLELGWIKSIVSVNSCFFSRQSRGISSMRYV